MKIKIIISKFDTIQYKLNFLFRNFGTIRNISNFDTIETRKKSKKKKKRERERETDRQTEGKKDREIDRHV